MFHPPGFVMLIHLKLFFHQTFRVSITGGIRTYASSMDTAYVRE